MSELFIKDYYPYDTSFFRPVDRFNDFFNSYFHIANLNPYEAPPDSTRAHLPFTHLLQYFFDFAVPFPSPFLSFALFFAVFVAFFIWYCSVNLADKKPLLTTGNVLVFSILSYPFLSEIDRAHIEGIVFIFLCLFIYYYRKNKFILSALFLSVALATKPYFAVFLVLFISDKKYKEIIYVLLSAFLLNLAALLIFKGDILANIQNLLANINLNQKLYTIGDEGIYFSHTVFSAIKIYFIDAYGYSRELYQTKVLGFSKTYFYMAVSIFAMLSFYILKFEKEFWKKITLLCVAMLVLPYQSGDFRLIHLYIPLFLFINSGDDENRNTGILYTILFALLLIPKDYWHYSARPEISSSIILTPLIMIILSTVIITEGLRNAKKKFPTCGH
ncbi:MAG: glycosyltransferase 87 family protein [Victivallales bacterium]|jgi:hypothetical protein